MITFYYGRDDTWTPVKYIEEMKLKFPDLDIRVGDQERKHVFVLNERPSVAIIVANILKEKVI